MINKIIIFITALFFTLKISAQVDSISQVSSLDKEVAKGIISEINGSSFAALAKQRILKEEAEVKTIWNSLFYINPILNQSFDYEIQNGEPVALNNDNQKWKIPIRILIKTNKNIEIVFNYIKNIFNDLSMNPDEIANYEKLGKTVYTIKIDEKSYFFRTLETIQAIEYFFFELEQVTRNYYIDDGVNLHFGYWISSSVMDYKELFNFSEFYSNENGNGNYKTHRPFENYISSGGGSVKFDRYLSEIKDRNVFDISFNKLYTLNEIEKISSFKVSNGYSITKLGSWHNGGRIFYIDSNNNAYICPLLKNHYNLKYEMVTLINGLELPHLNTVEYRSFRDSIHLRCSPLLSKINLDTSIGSGYLNTANFLKAIPSYYNTPQLYCKQFSFLNFKDWYLPSEKELQELIYFFKDYNSSSIREKYYSGPYGRDFISSSNKKTDPMCFIAIQPRSKGSEQWYDNFNGSTSLCYDLFTTHKYIKIIPIRSERLELNSFNPKVYNLFIR